MKSRYSIFSLARNAMNYHKDWERAWRSPQPKAEYDAVIVGAGGHGLAVRVARLRSAAGRREADNGGQQQRPPAKRLEQFPSHPHALYAKYGSPLLPDVPLQERMKGAIANQDFEALVATVEAHLAEAPNDIEGWKVLAPAYKRERRWSDAADAYANVLRLAPPTANAITDYGEMLVFANEGMVTDEAEGAFVEALKLEATNERANFYYNMALKQEGKAPALSDEQVAAVQAMPAQDQTAMIAGMIDGLEEKLGKDSRDLEGWKRLIRARRISNEIDKARISLDLALNIFKDEPATLDALRGLAKELGIN